MIINFTKIQKAVKQLEKESKEKTDNSLWKKTKELLDIKELK
jgi:hypothetical protein